MSHYDWDFWVLWKHLPALLSGMLVTLSLTLITIVVGTLVGTALALALSQRRMAWLRISMAAIVELLRALPLLVLLVWLYYFLPAWFGFGLTAFETAALALSLNLAAFVADLLRAAIRAVPTSQVEAGLAVGLTPRQVAQLIVLPEAFRASLPGLVALYITMFKMSTLASVIAVAELLHVGNTIITNSYRALEVYTGIAVLYLLVLVPASIAARRLERSRFFLRRV